MGVWIIILIVSLLSCLVGVIYLTATVTKFPFINRISNGKKWLRNLISLLLVIVTFLILMQIWSLTNAIVVFLGAFVIRLVLGILGAIIKKIRGREFKFYWQGWGAIILTVAYFAVGYYLNFNVWTTEYKLQTDKLDGGLRIAMFADSHIGTTFDGDGFAEKMDEIMKYNPDILLIVGDYVDDGTTKEDMIKASEALGELKVPYGVWYAIGNHDRGYNRAEDKTFDERELVKALMDNGVGILVDESVLIDDRFYLVGREDAYYADRASIEELTKDLDKNIYTIVMDHQPTDYANEAAAGVDLVLSGHTHGGQLFPVNHVGDWFGINDRTYGYEKRNNTDFIVTSGISCWEIKFKTGTKSEFVIIDLE